MAIERNVRIKTRISALISHLDYKTQAHGRGPKVIGQQKVVIDFPVQEYTDLYEMEARAAALALVINRGWELSDDAPCEVWMGDVLVDPVTALASFSAKVRSNNAATTVTWWIDISPNWDAVVLQAAAESPVTSVDDEKVTGTFDFSLFRGYTFYIQCGVTDGAKTTYSVIKSITIPEL